MEARHAEVGLRRENRAILDGAAVLAREAGADAVVLAAAADEEASYLDAVLPKTTRVITSTRDVGPLTGTEEDDLIPLPQVRLRRRGRAKVALLEGLASGVIHPGERVVVVSGDGNDGAVDLDTVALIDLTGQDEFLAGGTGSTLASLAHVADPAVFDTVLGLCLELSRYGRDGKPIGFLAVLGDHEAVLERSHPLVLNPFEGHGLEVRCVLYPAARRAIREFSGMDGAFVIRGDGIIEAAGRYLQEPADSGAVPVGLGARHRAAAGITDATRSAAFVVSETSGEVRIFSGGRVLMTFSRED